MRCIDCVFSDGVWWLADDVVESYPGARGWDRSACEPSYKALDARQASFAALPR